MHTRGTFNFGAMSGAGQDDHADDLGAGQDDDAGDLADVLDEILGDEPDVESDRDPDSDDEEARFVGIAESLGKKARPRGEYRRAVVVPDDERATSEIMTKYEYTRAVGIRAQQIDKTGTCYVEADGNNGDCVDLAEKEIEMRRSPLVLERVVGATEDHNPIVERWSVNEMALPTE